MATSSLNSALPPTVSVAVARGCTAVVVKPNRAVRPSSSKSRLAAACRFACFTPPMSRNGYQYIVNTRESNGCSHE